MVHQSKQKSYWYVNHLLSVPTDVAKYHGRIRFIPTATVASNLPYLKLIQIFILCVYFTILCGLNLFGIILTSKNFLHGQCI